MAGSSPCPLARDRGQHPHLIDARRFGGLQEGAWHANTKEVIGRHLTNEPGVDYVLEETRAWSGPAWRQPDLFVAHRDGKVAVEIQGASPQIGTVMDREEFYADLDYGLLWIVDADDLIRLERQGFQDIFWPRRGTVFGWSRAAQQVSLEAGRLHLHRLAVSEHDDRLVIEACLVPFATVVAEVMAQVPPRPCVADDGLAEAYLEALLSGDEDAEQEAYEQLRIELGLTATWYEAWQDGVASAVAATVTALTGSKAMASGHGEEDWKGILNNVFGAARHQPWTPLVLQACSGHEEAEERLAFLSTARLIRAALTHVTAEPGRADLLCQRWAPLFARLFPASAGSLLS